MMRRAPPLIEKGRKFSLDTEGSGAQTPVSSSVAEEYEAPIWSAFRQKIFSFVRSGSKSPINRSPGSKSPGNRSPTGLKSPFSTSPSNRSPSNRSPSSKSPTNRSPSVRSPTTTSPSRGTPCVTPPLKSPPAAASVRRSSFSKSSRESRSSSGEAEYLFVTPRRGSVATSHSLKKGRLDLALKRDNNDSCESSSGTPGTGSPGTPIGGRKAKIKLKGSPAGEFMDLQKMDDDLRFAEAALRPRKWSYHGTASPAAPVEAPKRHSFSTSSDHKSGIVVSNNDLAKLLGQNRLLLPGFPLSDIGPLPVLPNPRARGRSQSIAVCALSIKPKGGKSAGNEPVAPVLIRTTDCDHLASIQAHDSIDSQKDDEDDEDPEKLMWDSSGSTVNINLLGSVIEKYLKTTRGEDDDDDNDDSDDERSDNEEVDLDPEKRQAVASKEINNLDPDSDPMEPSGGLTPSFKGLQVK